MCFFGSRKPAESFCSRHIVLQCPWLRRRTPWALSFTRRFVCVLPLCIFYRCSHGCFTVFVCRVFLLFVVFLFLGAKTENVNNNTQDVFWQLRQCRSTRPAAWSLKAKSWPQFAYSKGATSNDRTCFCRRARLHMLKRGPHTDPQSHQTSSPLETLVSNCT